MKNRIYIFHVHEFNESVYFIIVKYESIIYMFRVDLETFIRITHESHKFIKFDDVW